ncbi:hypothetical protein [Pseudomonas sp. ME-P-057]|uniref:hypothetical protein n=1 Tax=Pseudomonas sp. ME-P-057 TaxID=3040321 RepID=UPI0025542525|nr:hypothetical protein [Pseudomonas sp. ME-P-057]
MGWIDRAVTVAVAGTVMVMVMVMVMVTVTVTVAVIVIVIVAVIVIVIVTDIVGAGLLANPVRDSPLMWLNKSVRQQAGSYRGMRLFSCVGGE